jgi:hypothetical protein
LLRLIPSPVDQNLCAHLCWARHRSFARSGPVREPDVFARLAARRALGEADLDLEVEEIRKDRGGLHFGKIEAPGLFARGLHEATRRRRVLWGRRSKSWRGGTSKCLSGKMLNRMSRL